MRIIGLLFSAIILINATAKAQIITTIAGNGTAGSSGDGDLAINAQLNLPSAIAFDNFGNLLIADQGYGIRQVDAKTGIITTIIPETNIIKVIAVDSHNDIYFAFGERSLQVIKIDQTNREVYPYAGNFTIGSSGDGGPAVDAQVADIVDIKFDKDDNLYILEGEYGNRDVRRVDYKTGIISRVAGNGDHSSYGDGGPAIEAGFSGPLGIAFDSKGNLLISEPIYGVRKVDLQTGIISKLPFSAAYFVRKIILDKQDNIYYVDFTHISKIDNKTYEETNIAGNGYAGFNGDNIPAVNAELNYAQDIAFDTRGNLVIADLENNRIRSVSKVDLSLPIAISSFTVSGGRRSNTLYWKTGVEANSNGFNIEKSTGGINFYKIGFQKAKGSNSNYEFIDQSLERITYYRLKLLDFDGSSDYSKVVKAVNNESPGKMAICPNPAKNKITISNTSGSIFIFNSTGQLVLSQPSNGTSSEIDVSKLASGVYLVKDSTGDYGRFIKR